MHPITPNSDLHQLMRNWRRDIHAHPETAYEEFRTSAKVAELLNSFGLDVETGLATTGVVATLKGNQPSTKSIALRADMDALHLQELNTFDHCSTHKGKMHGCGHDGHTTMLLGAAKYLAENPNFAGTVYFIFQPAEEGEAGAKRMCDEGLFDKYPADAVYGMHNWPGLDAGSFAIHSGPVMAATASFDIEITGQGCHAGMPNLGVDAIAVAGQLITSMQTLISRNLDPLQSGVISITKVHGGEAYNVIPESVQLAGTCRTFDDDTQDQLRKRMEQMIEQTCAAFGAKGTLSFRKGYPATINTRENANACIDAIRTLVPEQQIDLHRAPSMGAEDFSFMLKKCPGAYIWIGNGCGKNGRGLHNPYYDFNDEILPLGASFWVTLVQQQLV